MTVGDKVTFITFFFFFFGYSNNTFFGGYHHKKIGALVLQLVALSCCYCAYIFMVLFFVVLTISTQDPVEVKFAGHPFHFAFNGNHSVFQISRQTCLFHLIVIVHLL